MSEKISDYVNIAQIGRPVGLDGWCRIFPQGQTLESLALPTSIMVGGTKPETLVTINKLRGASGALQAMFSGYDNSDAVDALKNLVVFVEQVQLPPVAENEFYHFELEGIEAYGEQSGKLIGVVLSVHNYPSVDALEVRRPSGLVLEVPFNETAVPRIDREARQLFLNEDFLEELLS